MPSITQSREIARTSMQLMGAAYSQSYPQYLEMMTELDAETMAHVFVAHARIIAGSAEDIKASNLVYKQLAKHPELKRAMKLVEAVAGCKEHQIHREVQAILGLSHVPMLFEAQALAGGAAITAVALPGGAYSNVALVSALAVSMSIPEEVAQLCHVVRWVHHFPRLDGRWLPDPILWPMMARSFATLVDQGAPHLLIQLDPDTEMPVGILDVSSAKLEELDDQGKFVIMAHKYVTAAQDSDMSEMTRIIKWVAERDNASLALIANITNWIKQGIEPVEPQSAG